MIEKENIRLMLAKNRPSIVEVYSIKPHHPYISTSAQFEHIMATMENLVLKATAADVFLAVARCMTKAWDAPILVEEAQAVLEKEGRDDMCYELETKYVTMKAKMEGTHDDTKSWAIIKLRFHNLDHFVQVQSVKWLLLPGEVLAQLRITWDGGQYSDKVQACMTWRDVEEDLADMWEGAAYWWNKVAKLQKQTAASEDQDAIPVDGSKNPEVE